MYGSNFDTHWVYLLLLDHQILQRRYAQLLSAINGNSWADCLLITRKPWLSFEQTIAWFSNVSSVYEVRLSLYHSAQMVTPSLTNFTHYLSWKISSFWIFTIRKIKQQQIKMDSAEPAFIQTWDNSHPQDSIHTNTGYTTRVYIESKAPTSLQATSNRARKSDVSTTPFGTSHTFITNPQ